MASTSVKRALLIGIRYDGTDASLDTSHTDVDRMFQLLLRRCGVKEQDIKVLKDDEHLGYDAQPTKENIFSAMDWLVEDVSSLSSSRFLYYTGHGGQLDTAVECIYPVDAIPRYGSSEEEDDLDYGDNVITDDELHTTLIKPLSHSPKTRLVAIFDSCNGHDNSILDLEYTYGFPRNGETGGVGLTAGVGEIAEMMRKMNGGDPLPDIEYGEMNQGSQGRVISLSTSKLSDSDDDADDADMLPGVLSQALMDILDDNLHPLTCTQLLTQLKAQFKRTGDALAPYISTDREIQPDSTKFTLL